MDELFDKKVECPICKNEFTTKKVRTSRLRLLKRDEDFLNHYETENPIKYNIFVCPNCGYAAYDNKFDSIDVEEAEKIIRNISTKWHKRDFGGVRDLEEAIETYKLAIVTASLTRTKELEFANLCLNIAWLNRLKDETEEEIRFLSLARERFIEAFNNESLVDTNMDDSKLSYLIAELSRRLGLKEDALSWFNTCLGFPETKLNPALDEMAREQWRLTKEM